MKTEKQKQEWLKKALSHQKEDRFIQGKWLNGQVGEFKSGCFFGCMTQSDENTLETASKEMDIPLWIISVAEKIFEGLPEEEAIKFPFQFIKAITVGKNYNQSYKDWHYNLLMDKEHGQINYNNSYAIIKCAELFKMDKISKSAVKSAVESAARLAAKSAAKSAAWAAWSAESVAESAAKSAAWSAESAGSAAWLAESAKSAWSSAESAAKSAAENHYKWLRNEILKIL